MINYNHVMPTRYSVDISFDKTNLNKELLKVLFKVVLKSALPTRESVGILEGINLSLISLCQSRRAGQRTSCNGLNFPASLLLFYELPWAVPEILPNMLIIIIRFHTFLNQITSCILSEDVQDPMKKKKARNMVRTKFEERYKSGKNRY